MTRTPARSSSSMVLVWATIDGRPVLVCPRVTCESTSPTRRCCRGEGPKSKPHKPKTATWLSVYGADFFGGIAGLVWPDQRG
jgi:hypothetical protein